MDIVEILRQDYQRFPADQTYSIYADDVYFKDPLNSFKGIKRYQKMIAFLDSFFGDIELQLQDITRDEAIITTKWTLNMTSPLPWKPRLSIPGWTELKLNGNGLIVSHIDRWQISTLDVLSQNFFWRKKGSQ